jgi:4-hydroxy-tetrahydrodipicolinate synthase
LGAHGSVAAILTAAPKATVALWNAVKASDHARAHALHRGLLPLWNAMVGDNLPVCTRFAQSLRGIDPGVPRAPMPPTSAEQRAHIESSLKALLAIG